MWIKENRERPFKNTEMDHVIVYQENKESLDPEWEVNGFRLLQKFSWKEHADLLDQEKVLLKEPPVWFLLQKSEA